MDFDGAAILHDGRDDFELSWSVLSPGQPRKRQSASLRPDFGLLRGYQLDASLLHAKFRDL
ncbi:MAG: hypothetical protein CMJ75_03565 [Planctomycetaceae bacterium]|nr:hypothetical protein [Planctomycetaceae bacterium]